MTISERYKIASINRKKPYNKRFLFIAIFLVLVFSFTFSRYTETGNAELIADVANWKIKINGQIIDENTPLTSSVNLKYENGSNTNVILPGQKGYFDVVIDPTDTEVSIMYNIDIDITHMPSDLKLTGYIVNPETNNTVTDFTGEYVISDTIRLQNNQPLDSSNKVVYRIKWNWVGNRTLDESENYYITTDVSVKQFIQ